MKKLLENYITWYMLKYIAPMDKWDRHRKWEVPYMNTSRVPEWLGEIINHCWHVNVKKLYPEIGRWPKTTRSWDTTKCSCHMNTVGYRCDYCKSHFQDLQPFIRNKPL